MENCKIELRGFMRFLKDKGAYSQYLSNLTEKHKSSDYVKKILEESNAARGQKLLSKAFGWADSKEGDDFWRGLHTEWIRSWLGIDHDNCSRNDILDATIKNQFE